MTGNDEINIPLAGAWNYQSPTMSRGIITADSYKARELYEISINKLRRGLLVTFESHYVHHSGCRTLSYLSLFIWVFPLGRLIRRPSVFRLIFVWSECRHDLTFVCYFVDLSAILSFYLLCLSFVGSESLVYVLAAWSGCIFSNVM